MRIITNTKVLYSKFTASVIFLFAVLATSNAQCPGTIDAGEDFYACAGDDEVYSLHGNISGDWISFEWLPNAFVVNPFRLETEIILLQSTTFELIGTFISDNNLIENPGFEDGLNGYSNDPSYGTGYFSNGSILTQNGPISSGANGTESFLFQNTHCPGLFPAGSLVAGQNVENVLPNTDYEFCFWIANLNQINTAVIQLEVNGVVVGTGSGSVNGLWVQHCFTWNSGPATEAFLGLVNLTGECFGNDFGIDELVFNERCKQSDFVNVYLEELTLDIETPQQINCAQTSFSWSANATSLLGNTIELSLINENGDVVNFTSDETIEISDAGTYTVIANSPESGCMLQEEFTVEIDTMPPMAFEGEPQEINCMGTVQLDATQNDGSDFVWSTDDGNFVSDENTLTPIVDQAGSYILTISDSNGCTTAVAYDVFENAETPEINASADGVLTCIESSVTISADGSAVGPEFEYVWTNGQGEILNPADPLSFEVDEVGIYYLVITNTTTSCSSEMEVLVVANLIEPIIVSETPGILTCDNRTALINLEGSSAGDEYTYIWSNENGVLVDVNNQDFLLLAAAGIYSLEIVNNSNGCSTSTTFEILEDFTEPEAIVLEPEVINCLQEEVELQVLNANSNVVLSFDWSSLDGHTLSNTSEAQISVTEAGVYSVVLTNPENGCTNEYQIEVASDLVPPVIEPNVPEVLNCLNNSTILNFQNPSQNVLSVIWTDPNGNPSSDSDLEATMAGIYTLLVTDEDNGCTSTSTIEVVDDFEIPQVDAGDNAFLTCDQTEALLQGTINLNVDYTINWTTTNGSILSGENTLTPLVNAAGLYTLTLTNLSNGCENISTVEVTQDADTPVADAGPIGEITCNDQFYTLDATGSSSDPNYTFEWGTDNGVFDAGENSLTPTVSTAGNYFLTITNTTNQCSAVSSVQVSENFDAPEIQFSEPFLLNCEVQSFELSNLLDDPNLNLSYSWSTDNNATINAIGNILTINQGGNYTLEVINEDNGCSQIANIEVFENLNQPEIDAGVDLVLNCQENAVSPNVMIGSSLDNYDIVWNTLDGNILAIDDPLNPVFNQAGTYQIEIIDQDSKCSTIDELVVSNDATIPEFLISQPEILNCDLQSQVLSASINTTGQDFSYLWNTANGNILSDQSSTSIELDAPGVYNLVITDLNNGCTAEQEILVEQNILVPLSSADVSGILSCVENTVSLIADQQTTQNVIYQWTTSSGNIVSGENETVAEVDQAGTYTLITTFLENQCSSSIEVVVTQDDDLPIAIIENGDQLSCITNSITLNASGSSSGDNISFFWQSDNGQLITEDNSLSPQVTEPGIYTLTIINEVNGCESAASILIEENVEVPSINLLTDAVLNCNNASINIENDFDLGAGNYSFEWTSTNGKIEGPTNSNLIEVTAPGTYSLMVTNLDNGCINDEEIVIFQDLEDPIAQISEPLVLNCLNETIALDAEGSSEGDQFSYVWMYDGEVIDDAANNLVLEAEEAGVYILIITNETNGCTRQTSVEVLADLDIPTITLSDPGILNCFQPEGIISSEGSSLGTNFEHTWMHTSGEIITANSESSLTVDEAGIYILQIRNIENSCVSETSIIVDSDFETPSIDAGPGLTLNCYEPTLNLQGQVETPTNNFSIDWNTLDGQILSGENELAPEIGMGGVYEMIVTNDRNGCSSVDHVLVESDLESPTASLIEPETINCLVEEVSLELVPDSALTDYDVEWSTNGNTIPNGSTPTDVVVNASGVYEVILVNNINGCSSEYSTIVLEDLEEPEVDAGEGSTFTCSIASLSLNAMASTGSEYVYIWTTTDGEILSNENSLNPVVGEAGTYILEVVNQENGCSAIDEVVMSRITDVPRGMEISTIDPLCPGETGSIFFEFIDGGAGPYEYSIDGGNTFQAASEFENLPAGRFNLLIQDANGCTLSDIVIIPEIPQMNVNLVPELNILIGEEEMLEPILTNLSEFEISSIQWTPSRGLSCDNCLNPIASPDVETLYEIEIITEDGCPLKASVLLKVDRDISVYIPNAFSPFNNDGINDIFYIYAKDGAVVNVESFQIYDRWGNKVFHQENFLPNDPAFGWNGTYRSKEMNTGVFVYYAVIELIDGTTVLFEGDLTLVY